MSQLDVPQVLRKRSSTSAIREGEEGRKRACGMTATDHLQKEMPGDQGEAESGSERKGRQSYREEEETVPGMKDLAKARQVYREAEEKAKESGNQVERRPRRRVTLPKDVQPCCICGPTRFRTNGVCRRCTHPRCQTCLLLLHSTW